MENLVPIVAGRCGCIVQVRLAVSPFQCEPVVIRGQFLECGVFSTELSAPLVEAAMPEHKLNRS
jgi:hypothetical protein